MKTLPITLYTIPRTSDEAMSSSEGAVGYDPERDVYGLMSFGLLSYAAYHVKDLVTEERIEELLTTKAPFVFYVDTRSKLAVSARTLLETLRGFELIGPQYDDRIASLPEALSRSDAMGVWVSR